MQGMKNCPNCGQLVCLSVIQKRLERNIEDALAWHCADCRLKPVLSIRYMHPVLGLLYCYPWQGELNDDWYPVDDNGDLVKPGERVCGHKDCVNSNHIEPFRRIVDEVEDVLEGWKKAPLPKE